METTGKLPASFYIIDTSARCLTGDVLEPFAEDELLCRRVGEGAMPLVRLWRHEKAFVMGLRDRRLPQAPAAMAELEREGYAVAVRHSGGAAVPLDAGVVNISLVLPKRAGETNFHAHFELMYSLLRDTLREFSLCADKGEIAGSYCPGDYDVSVGGRKFCGLAQRRQMKAFAVQAFVVVEGSGRQRAARVREFYRTAAAGADAADYPAVQPESMISLQEAGGIRIADFVPAFTARLAALGGIAAAWDDVRPERQAVRRTTDELRAAYEQRGPRSAP